jgi:predicted acyl esterase
VLLDEYLPQEQEDGVDVIAWAAAQPWCSGAVGLIGKSWGGFNALQIAARRPPALRGIVTVCSTDDRYADDVHYMGGCLLNDSLWWGGVFFQLCAQPPDPELVGADWRALWQARLEAAHPHPLRWLEHPMRDDYWRQGSVCEDYSAIACPVYAVGGWADALLERDPAPARGPRRRRGAASSGPGDTSTRTRACPAPRSASSTTRSRGGTSACAASPAPRRGRSTAPGCPRARPDAQRRRPGRWVAEASWPSPASSRACSTCRAVGSARPDRRACSSALEPDHGRASGGWLVASLHDQREDDAESLCFDGEPLRERTEMFGAPELRLVVARISRSHSWPRACATSRPTAPRSA